MAYQINKFDTSLLTSLEDGTIDQTSDLKLIGKNYAGYGEIQNENFVFLLENFAGGSQPPRAIKGQLWFDATNEQLKVYDGTRFKAASTANVATSAPVGLVTGDFWWDETNEQLYAYNGTDYTLVGPQSSGADTTQNVTATVQDNTGANKRVIKATVADEVVYVISNEEFTLNAGTPITGFTKIKKGITLKNTDSTGKSTTDATGFMIWGTAGDALKLGGVDASSFVRNDSAPSFNTVANFADAGLQIGANDELQLLVDSGIATIQSAYGNNSVLRFRTTNGAGSLTTICTMDINGIIPGADDTYDLGSSSLKWANVYATTFNGVATQAESIRLAGTDYYGSLGATINTVALRDGTGVITATTFAGTATNADLATSATNLKVGINTYAPAFTATPNTVAIRDAGGSVSATSFSDTILSITNGTISSAVSATFSGTVSTDTLSATTLTDGTATLESGDLTGLQTVLPDSNNTRNIGRSDLKWNTVYASTFEGVATSAKYADLAEVYETDQEYSVGTIIAVGGDKEVRSAKMSDFPIGVISEKPAYLMNAEAEGQAVALKGRVPVRVKGPVSKGQPVYAWQDGVATTIASTGLVGVALESSTEDEEKLIECVLKV